jgi:hypothetical protein
LGISPGLANGRNSSEPSQVVPEDTNQDRKTLFFLVFVRVPNSHENVLWLLQTHTYSIMELLIFMMVIPYD